MDAIERLAGNVRMHFSIIGRRAFAIHRYQARNLK